MSRDDTRPRWRTKTDIAGLLPPETKAAENYRHATQPGLYLRIGKRRADGKVRRTFIVRLKTLQPDGTTKDDPRDIGLFADIGDGSKVIDIDTAVQEAIRLLTKEKAHKGGHTVRMIVQDAYDKLCEGLDSNTSQDSPDYATKLRKTVDSFPKLGHWGCG